MNIDQIKSKLVKLGYAKQAMKTKSIILVYVPKSERDYHMGEISKAFNAEIDQSGRILRAVSSAGAVKVGDFYIGVKPDQSTGLKTDEQETLQGIFIATRFSNPKTDYSLDDLRKGEKFVDSAYKIDALYEKAGKAWIAASIITANKIATYTTGTYRVQQRSGSQFEDNISKQAKLLIKKAGQKLGLDKWNPADIWLVRPSFIKTDFTKFKTIVSLNEFLLEQHKQKNIIGVSLKMVKKTAKLEVFNDGVKKEINFKPPGKTDLGASFTNSINGTIYYSGGSIVIRSFGRPESVSAEINGKFAQGGKAGSGPLFQIIKDIRPRFKTESHQAITKMFNGKKSILIKHLYRQMKKMQPENITEKEFEKKILAKKNALTYCISKYQACDIIQELRDMTRKQQEEFIDAVLSYAASSTKISSIFVKIS